MSYFMSRIQRENGNFTTGFEVHDTLEAAQLSFWGRMKLAYGKSDADFVSCKIINENGEIVKPYDMTWKAPGDEENRFFLHHIRKNGEAFDDKAIDNLDSLDIATGNLAALMEYGYNNPKFQNVSLVYCMITDLLSGGMVLMDHKWIKTVEPAPEPEPEPAE